MDDIVCLQSRELESHNSVPHIDYEYTLTTEANVRSLQNLCATKSVLSERILVTKSCTVMPQRIRKMLMRFAISLGCKTPVSALLNSWTREEIIFDPPVPFRTWRMLATPYEFSRLSEISGVLIHIIEIVMTLLTPDLRRGTRIRHLDFSAFPIGPDILQNICCLITRKCKLFSENVVRCMNNRGDRKRPYLEVQGSTNDVIIKVNCNIDCEKVINSLCSTLSLIKTSEIPLKLLVTGLHIISYSVADASVAKLFDLLQPEALDAFTVCVSGLSDLGEYCNNIHKLKKFPNLRAVCLKLLMYPVVHEFMRLYAPYNHLPIIEPSEYTKVIESTTMVSQIHNVKHFSLQFFDERDLREHFFGFPMIPTEIAPIRLSSITKSLECLTLQGYKTSAEDLKDLSMSSLQYTLKTLNMSTSEVDLQSLVLLLTACENLRVVNLSDCVFLDGNVDILFHTFSGMKKLTSLNICRMDMTSEDLLSKVPLISTIKSLHHLSMSPNGVLGLELYNFQMMLGDALKLSLNGERNVQYFI